MVALLNRTPRTPRFDWSMARLVVENRHQKDMCSDEIIKCTDHSRLNVDLRSTDLDVELEMPTLGPHTFYTRALKPPVIHEF